MKKRIPVLDVFVNGKKWCRAGVGARGVLGASVTWVHAPDDAMPVARQGRQSTSLLVAGLAENLHRRWGEKTLKLGDRVLIRVAEAEAFDPPTWQAASDRKLEEKLDRQLYARLKRKFANPRRRKATT